VVVQPDGNIVTIGDSAQHQPTTRIFLESPAAAR
jgi:hypothetical protein